MFELYRRDGHGKEKVYDGDDLGDIAVFAMEKEGLDPDDLIDVGVFEDG
jgi:hypothetical protein